MYKFSEPKNTMVITTKSIVTSDKGILLVSHDADDGMWQFLDGNTVDEKDALILSLQEIVQIDCTVNDIHDLPPGWIAYRIKRDAQWIKKPLPAFD